MAEQKLPPTIEKSLNYISWTLKDLVTEIKELVCVLKEKNEKDAFDRLK